MAVNYREHFPTFASHMPSDISRGHYSPEWKGDRSAVYPSVAHRHPPVVDQNFQVYFKSLVLHRLGCEIYNVHWANPGQNNYHWILNPDGKSCRHMTSRELRRTRWKASDVARWRRTSSPHSERPRTWEECVVQAKAHHVIITPELKSPTFGGAVAAKLLVDVCRKHDYPCWSMALWWMKNCKNKAKAVTTAGGQFAVLAHGKHHPPSWFPRYRKYVTRVWNGNWNGK